MSIVQLGEHNWWEHEGPVPPSHDSSNLTRNWFPKDFIFGTGTAAYQVEGYAQKGGRGISLWDEYAMKTPDRIADGSNGNVACEMYTRYKDDIKLMKKMGFDSYRFSISWPRILPGGRPANGVNQEGIDYYNDVIDTVLENGMIPFVTIFHWDLPLNLEKEYGGFLSKRIKVDFREYAELCFWEFGDRVKHWTTINEPWTFAAHGYVTGTTAPGKKVPVPDTTDVPGPCADIPKIRAQAPTSTSCKIKDHGVATPSEAYTVARNLLLAHAEAVDLYRTKFKDAQKGKIGIVLVTHYFFPLDKNSLADQLAVKRALDFMLGWFLEPILYGTYPKSMLECVPPDNLASFTPQDLKKLVGSIDFLGLNYYTTQYAAHVHNPVGEGYAADQHVNFSTKDKHDEPIGTASGSEWLFSVPTGLYGILNYLHETYPELKEIYITENGYSVASDHAKTAKMVCSDDNNRIKYHQDHLVNILKALKDDVFDKVKGYYVWTFCDNYEWGGGYTVRFGLVYIDYINNLTRYPKDSCAWFAKFLKSNEQPPKWFNPWWKPTVLGDKRARQTEGQNGGEDKRLKVVQNNMEE